MKYIKGDLYTNGLISSVCEGIGYLTSGFFVNALGIRKVLVISYTLSIIGMVCLIGINTESIPLLALFVLGSKFGIAQTFNIAYAGNVLFFPTSMVATSFGVCNFFSRGATIFSPYLAELKPISISQWVFAAVCAISIVASILLKEKTKVK